MPITANRSPTGLVCEFGGHLVCEENYSPLAGYSCPLLQHPALFPIMYSICSYYYMTLIDPLSCDLGQLSRIMDWLVVLELLPDFQIGGSTHTSHHRKFPILKITSSPSLLSFRIF